MSNTFLQWNCRGLRANYNEILLLLSNYSPAVLALQETHLKESDDVSLKNYSLFNFISTDNRRASGGASLAISNRVIHSQIHLNTPFQAVAARVTLHKSVSVCSVYLPPNDTVDPLDLENLIKQLPEPFILLGDLNGHSPLWGCSDCNSRGKIIEDFIGKHNLCLFNDKSFTYLHPGTGHYSSLDLSLCSPSLFLDYEFKVHDDLCGSDHFPTILNNTSSPVDDHMPRWKFSKANWELFNSQCMLHLTPDKFADTEDPIDEFSSTLLRIAEECIPKTSTNLKRNRPWFDEDCKKSIRERRAAVRRFNLRPTSDNLTGVKVFRAKARRTIRQAKRKSWHNYVSKLNSRSSMKKVWNMVRKISGKGQTSSVSHLQKSDSELITNKKDIADCLAETFSKNSSSANYSEAFQKVKHEKEKTKLIFQILQ